MEGLPVIRVMHVVRPVAGGIKNHLISLIRNSDRERFHHMVACPPGGLAEATSSMGVETFPAPIQGEISPWRDAAAAGRLAALLKKSRADIMHAHGFKAGLVGRVAARLAGISSVVLTVHGSFMRDRQPGWKKGLMMISDRLLAGCTGRIIVVCDVLGREIAEIEKISPEKIVTVYNGIAAREFDRPPDIDHLRQATGIPAGKKIVGTVARLAPQKGVDDFIKAAARIAAHRDDAVFLVVGDGPLRRDLEREAAAQGLGGRIFFAGERRDVAEILPCMDVFVLASRTEGLPLTVLEALAASRPVVATRVGGVPEVINDGISGILVDPGDIAGLSSAVNRMLDDGELRRNLGLEGKSAVSRDFTPERMAAGTENVYMEVFNSRKSR